MRCSLLWRINWFDLTIQPSSNYILCVPVVLRWNMYGTVILTFIISQSKAIKQAKGCPRKGPWPHTCKLCLHYKSPFPLWQRSGRKPWWCWTSHCTPIWAPQHRGLVPPWWSVGSYLQLELSVILHLIVV